MSFPPTVRTTLLGLVALLAVTSATAQDVGVPRWVAVQRGATGACEVIYGTAGVQPDDRVFGLYASEAEAQAALAAHCHQTDSRRSPTSTPTRIPPTPTTSWRATIVPPTPTPRADRPPTATPWQGTHVRHTPPPGSADGWREYPDVGACIGGERCGGRVAVVALELDAAPVAGLRWTAHADVGSQSEGQLQVKIDGDIIAEIRDIGRDAQPYDITVNNRRGRRLVIAPAANDEVVVESVAVRYGNDPPGQQTWTPYPQASICFGGTRCADRGNHVAIELESRPVSGVRLRAHDDVGNVTKAHLRLRIDDTVIAHDLDIERTGSVFEVDLAGLHGQQLVVEALTDDEVEIEELAVRYGLPEQSVGWRSLIQEPACIGGRLCADSGAELRFDLGGAGIKALRLVLHDRVGSLANGRLRVAVDDRVLETIDVPDTATAIELGLDGTPGRWLLLRAVADDEVVLERVEVRAP